LSNTNENATFAKFQNFLHLNTPVFGSSPNVFPTVDLYIDAWAWGKYKRCSDDIIIQAGPRNRAAFAIKTKQAQKYSKKWDEPWSTEIVRQVSLAACHISLSLLVGTSFSRCLPDKSSTGPKIWPIAW
jgi:hypothetical protein